MSNTLILVIIAGTALCLMLGWYALSLWRQQQRQQQLQTEHKQKNRDKLAGDLSVLLSSLLDEQAPWVELCIRIKVVLDHYDCELGQQDDYQVFQRVYQACENIPTHQAWKDLTKAERRTYEVGFVNTDTVLSCWYLGFYINHHIEVPAATGILTKAG
ncbi:MAG: DUF2489 domain-containing protein [Gammaproteobacteria bacterium]|nr:DUF2489 domain-containing protein [Gammaproteobacteria bacterium]